MVFFLKFGFDLMHPNWENWDTSLSDYFDEILLPRMDNLLRIFALP